MFCNYFNCDRRVVFSLPNPFGMMLRLKLALYVITGLFTVTSGYCQGKKSIWKVTSTPDFELTGSGSSAEWNNTQWVTLGNYKGTAPYETRAKLLYSSKGVYGLFSCPDRKITATLKEDFADLYLEDVVEIFFWPDETSRLYFEYELSPLNYELPILVPNFNGNFFGWRPWHYEGERKTRHQTHIARDAEGNVESWTAEFFIPYALLKPLNNVNPGKGTQWRINLYRIDYDDNYSSWTWQRVNGNFHEIDSYGTLEFQ